MEFGVSCLMLCEGLWLFVSLYLICVGWGCVGGIFVVCMVNEGMSCNVSELIVMMLVIESVLFDELFDVWLFFEVLFVGLVVCNVIEDMVVWL